MKERMIQLKREERGLSDDNGSASSSDRFDGIELLEEESTVCFLILGRVFRFLIFIQTTTIIEMIKITIASEIQMTVVVE